MGESQEKTHKEYKDQVVIFQEAAEIDISEAFGYYFEISATLAADFLAEMERSISLLKRNPYSYQEAFEESRRVLLRRFPYGIFYVVSAKRISVIACLHQRADENRISERLM